MMTNTDRTLLTLLTGVVVGLPAVLGSSLRWPTWLWLVLIALLLLVPLFVYRRIRHRMEQQELRGQTARRPEPVQPTPPPFQPEVMPTVHLPSAVADYEFLFSATVMWRLTSNAHVAHHANPAALAVAAIIERAEAVTKQEPPHRHTVAWHLLNSVLGTVLADRSGAVEAWAEQAQLTLSDADLARLRKLSDVRKEKEVWEYGRNHERNKREYYGEDVFKDPGSALVWWLAHTDDVDVRGAVELIGTLAQLSAAANNTMVPELLPALLTLGSSDARLPTAAKPDAISAVRDLMDSLGVADDNRALFVRRLASVVKGAGRPDAAADIQDAFDLSPAEWNDQPEPEPVSPMPDQ